MLYYPEIGVLLKEATGAEKVVVFDHQARNIEFSKHDGRTLGSTSGHNDYTTKSDRAACGITCQQPKRRRDCGIASRK